MGDKIWLKVAIDEHKMRKIVKNNLHRQHYNRLKKMFKIEHKSRENNRYISKLCQNTQK